MDISKGQLSLVRIILQFGHEFFAAFDITFFSIGWQYSEEIKPGPKFKWYVVFYSNFDFLAALGSLFTLGPNFRVRCRLA